MEYIVYLEFAAAGGRDAVEPDMHVRRSLSPTSRKATA